MTIGRELLRLAVELTLITSRLEDEQPGSLLITAEVEEGKTHLVSQYMSLAGVAYLADATAYGIINKYQQDLMAGKLSHLIFPELIRPLERQKETASALVAFLGELTEEGVQEIQTFTTSFRLPRPVKAGVIACIARGNLGYRVRHWNETGFLSRFLVISYSYSDATADEVRGSISRGEKPAPMTFELPPKGRVIFPVELTKDVALAAKALAQGLYPPLHGFRMQKHLQRLAKAHALKAGRNQVDESDVQVLREIAAYVNLDYRAI